VQVFVQNTNGSLSAALPYPTCTTMPSANCRYYVKDIDLNTGALLPGAVGFVSHPPVGRFLSPDLHPQLSDFSSDFNSGLVTLSSNGSGSTLTLLLEPYGGGTHTIWTNLNCISTDGGAPLCKP
jgi:hypothetical protein